MILPRKAPLTAPSTATLGLEVGGVKGRHSIPAAVSSMYPVEDWSEDRQVLPQMQGRRFRWIDSWCYYYCLPWPLSPIHMSFFLFQNIKCSFVCEDGLEAVRYSPPKWISFS